MKSVEEFVFRGLDKKEGGKFINDKGQEISFDPKYNLKVDEVTENGVFERIFKIPVDSKILETLLILKPYDKVTIEFDIAFYSNGVRVIPVNAVIQ